MKLSTGPLFEGQIKSALAARGFQIISHNEYRKNPGRFTSDFLLTNYSYGTTIFGKKGTAKFLLVSPERKMRIVIECKWQQGSGSTEHKIPYVYLNLLESIPEDDIIIVIDGGGWGKGTISWLKTVASSKKYTDTSTKSKNIRIVNLKEFITWVNETFV